MDGFATLSPMATGVTQGELGSEVRPGPHEDGFFYLQKRGQGGGHDWFDGREEGCGHRNWTPIWHSNGPSAWKGAVKFLGEPPRLLQKCVESGCHCYRARLRKKRRPRATPNGFAIPANAGFDHKLFGAALKRDREARELTQADVAKMIGCHAGSISRWEGGSRIPDMDEVYAVQRALQWGDFHGNPLPKPQPALIEPESQAQVQATVAEPETATDEPPADLAPGAVRVRLVSHEPPYMTALRGLTDMNATLRERDAEIAQLRQRVAELEAFIMEMED